MKHSRSQSICQVLAVGSFIALQALSTVASAQEPDAGHRCGPVRFPGHYGPYDYRNERNKLHIVESAHFTPRVEALLGSATGDMNADINYTLLSSPNHHRALITISRLIANSKSASVQLKGFDFILECYYDRALRFRPDDNVVRLIYAQVLASQNRREEGTAQVEAVLKTAADNPFTHYNAGLILFELKQYDKAVAQAHIAKKLGFPRTDLEEKLKQANQWQEPKEPPEGVEKPGRASSSPQ